MTGGLYVIGTERHESRRIDRQLRGRCARQGDPGLSKFFLSLEDELLRIFLQGNIASRLMEGTMKEGEELEHPWLNRSIESAQKKVEQQNFAIRKRLLQYDDVLNKQREVVYGIRNGAIHSERPKDIIFEHGRGGDRRAPGGRRLRHQDGSRARPRSRASSAGSTRTFPSRSSSTSSTARTARPRSPWWSERIKKAYAVKESVEVPEALGALERYVVINAIDHHWQEHLTEMEELRRSIGLRSYGQKDPLQEYKGEAYRYFEELMNNVRLQICTGLFRSATNLQAFENMLSILSRSARLQGPEDEPPAGTVARLRPPGPAGGPAPACRRHRLAGAARRPARAHRRRPEHAGSGSRGRPPGPRPSPRSSCPGSPSGARRPRSAATIPVPAAAARSTSIATGNNAGPRLFPPARNPFHRGACVRSRGGIA